MLKKPKIDDPEVFKYIGLITELGLSTAIVIVISVLITFYIIRALNLNTYFLTFGILIGLIAGYFNAYRIIKKFYGK